MNLSLCGRGCTCEDCKDRVLAALVRALSEIDERDVQRELSRVALVRVGKRGPQDRYRCGECGGEGHNVRTCERRKLQQQLAAGVAL